MEYSYLIHSKKGSQWKNHKYIKKVGNKYYYKETEITKDTSDADIIKGSLGKDYDAIRKKVLAKQKETGRTDLTDDEVKEILGDKYDEVKERLTDQASARDEVSGKNKEKATTKDDSEKKSTSKSSGSSSKSSGGSSGGSSSGKSSNDSSGSKTSSGTGSSSSKQSPTSSKSQISNTNNDKKNEKSFKSTKDAQDYVVKFRQKYSKYLSDKGSLSKIDSNDLSDYYRALGMIEHSKKSTGTLSATKRIKHSLFTIR